MPDVGRFSTEEAWMSACVPTMADEGMEQDQAVAACLQQWRDRDKAAARYAVPLTDDLVKNIAAIATNRAWSVLTVKAVDAERREIEGIASTPSVDRVGDVVEPLGAMFSLPMPLLHHHDSRAPVGHVTHAKAGKDGITIKAKLAQIAEPGPLKDRIDTAWQEIKSGLVRGLSIGFAPLEYEALEKGGLRFLKWAWFETSMVTIPAQADASITLVKSLDADQLAASGKEPAGLENGATKAAAPSRPGASGKPVVTLKSKERTMAMTTAEAISASQAARQAKAARMTALMEDVTAKGLTLDLEQANEYEGLKAEVDSLDTHLKRLEDLAKVQAVTAKPIEAKSTEDASAARSGSGTVRISAPPEEKGIGFARVAKCLAIAGGSRSEAVQVAESMYKDDQRIANVLKAAVAAGSTTNLPWAGALVSPEGALFADFLEYLREATIIGQFGRNGIPALRTVPFRVPLGSQTTGGAGYWTGEGMAKGLTWFDFAKTVLEPLKVAAITAVTEELLKYASLPAEALLRDQLTEALAWRVDTDFIDPAKTAVPGTSPASVTNGVTVINSSGGTADAVRADLAALLAPYIAAKIPLRGVVLVMSGESALAASLMRTLNGVPEFPGMTATGGALNGFPVIVSELTGAFAASPNAKYVWAIHAPSIYLGDEGGVGIAMSNEASLVMDTAPAMSSGGIGSPDAPTPAQLVSMFQTDSIAFRAERVINWQKARAQAVQGLGNVQWAA